MIISIISAFAVIMAILIAIYIVMEQRRPSSTIAWLWFIAIFPFVGIIAYFIFGQQRMVRKRLKKARLREECYRHLHHCFHDLQKMEGGYEALLRMLPMIRVGQIVDDMPVTVGNNVRLLKDYHETYPALIESFEKAEETIHVLFYMFHPDSIGQTFKEVLMCKAREGVHVRLIIDDFGSDLPYSWIKEMRESGMETEVFQPMRVPFAPFRMRLSFRNHRKLAVIDNKIAFTGGLNIGDEYAGKNKRIGHWRDTFVQIEGPGALALNMVFLEDWHYITNDIVDPGNIYYPEDGRKLVQIIGSGPDRPWRTIYMQYFESICYSRRTCYISTPYFIPMDSLETALIAAAMRGVDVRILLPGYNDSQLLKIASCSYYERLLKAGIRIYEYQDGFLHAKTICIDSEFGTVGSANLDPRSLQTNFEVNAFVYDKSFASQQTAMFLEDLEFSKEITLEDMKKKSIFRRAAESIVHIFSPLL